MRKFKPLLQRPYGRAAVLIMIVTSFVVDLLRLSRLSTFLIVTSVTFVAAFLLWLLQKAKSDG